MSTTIESTGSTQATVAPPDVRGTAPASRPESTDGGKVPTDVVHLSSAAQAALREAAETPAGTAKEARSGDPQAKHLLAKQAAAKAAATNTLHVVA
jgi:hypothetical protein